MVIKKLNSSLSRKISSQKYIINHTHVIKELIENSLDARSKKISIHISENELTVIDNGDGIDGEINEWSTSKKYYKDSTDIFGYKGIFLYSLKDVSSNLQIITKKNDEEIGRSYNFSHEQKICSPMAREKGTTIKIIGLFYNCARRKHLKINIPQIVNLCYDFIKIKNIFIEVIQNNKILFSQRGHGIFSYLKSKKYTEIDNSNNNLIHKLKKQEIKIYFCESQREKKIIDILKINGRLVKCKSLSNSIMKLCKTLFIKKTQFLFLLSNIRYDILSVDKEDIVIEQEIINEITFSIKEHFNKERTVNVTEQENRNVKEWISEYSNEKKLNNQENFMNNGLENSEKYMLSSELNDLNQIEIKNDEKFELQSFDHISNNNEFDYKNFENIYGTPKSENDHSRTEILKDKTNSNKSRNNILWAEKIINNNKVPENENLIFNQDKEFEELKNEVSNSKKKRKISKINKEFDHNLFEEEHNDLNEENLENDSKSPLFKKMIESTDKNNIECVKSVELQEEIENPFLWSESEILISQDSDKVPDILPYELKTDHIKNFTLSKTHFKKLQIIGQFNHGFILTKLKIPNDHSIFIIFDQHACDEIYNFEKLKKNCQFKKQKILNNFKKVNDTENKSNKEYEEISDSMIDSTLSHLTSSDLLDDTTDSFINSYELVDNKITALPALGKKIFTVADLHSLQENQESKELHYYFATKACRMSIMIGDYLKFEKCVEIIHRMDELEAPWNCPHGRPTFHVLGSI